MTKDELQASANTLGFDLFGVAPAEGLAAAVGWSRSVLVLGMAVLDAALDFEWYIETNGEQRWSKWAYERILAGAAQIALSLAERGYRSQPLTYENSLALLDLKVAAVRAGLGVWGLNSLVLAPKFGPRIRLGAVFTELALPPGEPLRDYYCASCSLCIAACPTHALSPQGFDRSRCIAEFEPDETMTDLQRKLLRFPTPHSRLQCRACIDVCPVGKRIPTRFWGLDPRPRTRAASSRLA